MTAAVSTPEPQEIDHNSLANRAGWLRWLIALFLTFHALAILHTLLPDWELWAKNIRWWHGDDITEEQKDRVRELEARSVALPPMRPLDPIFRNYKILSGTRQDWQMFHSSPRDHDLRIFLEAKDDQGTVHILGAGLPGFYAFDLLDENRYYHLMARLEYWNEEEYVNRYLDHIGTLLKQSEDPRYLDVTLVYEKHIIQKLDAVRETGKIATVKRKEFWRPHDMWKDPE